MNEDLNVLPPGPLTWVPAVRARLLERWRTPRSSDGSPLACDLVAAACHPGHLSLPCSIAADDQAIEALLAAGWSDASPSTLLRVLLLMLDDFVESLGYAYDFLKLRKPRAPDLISIWANRYAKHRRNVLVLHHPQHLYMDAPEAARWESAVRATVGVLVIDTKWLGLHNGEPDVVALKVNDDPAVLLVPKMEDFVDAAADYYAKFCQDVRADLAALRKFETADHELSFTTLLARVAPNLPPS